MISTSLKKLKDNEKDLIFLGLIHSIFLLEGIVFNGNSEMENGINNFTVIYLLQRAIVLCKAPNRRLSCLLLHEDRIPEF